MAKLILVRHGQSDWNLENRFTGWTDRDLTDKGIAEAHEAAGHIEKAGIKLDEAFTSELVRAQHTLEIILKDLDIPDLPTTKDVALNERDYGKLTGLNKDECRVEYGEEQVHVWRRSFDVPPPGGESLKDTAARTLPYFEKEIMPLVKEGKNIIIAAHGNSLRSIAMQLDKLTPDEVTKLEIATGVPIMYEIDEKGEVLSKKILE